MDDLATVIVAIGGLGGLLTTIGLGLRWVINLSTKRCDECCMERDICRKTNDEALAAFRKREEESAALWRQQQSGTHPGASP